MSFSDTNRCHTRDWFEDCWNQSVQKLSAPQMAEGRDILYRYYCDSVVPAEVMQRPLGIEGRIAAKVQFENIEFALTGRYDRLDNIDSELELIDYKTTKNPTIPDGIDVQWACTTWHCNRYTGDRSNA